MPTSLRRILSTLIVVVTIFLPALTTVAFAQTVDEIVQAGEIKIGVLAEAAPYGFLDDQQQLAGFEIDLANLLAKRMGVKANLIAVPAASRIQYLLTGKVDILMAFLAVTPERALQVLFSDPYSVGQTVLLAPARVSITTMNDLLKVRVATTRSSSPDLYLTQYFGDSFPLMRFDDAPSLHQALISGQVDAVADTLFNATLLEQSQPQLKIENKLTLFAQLNGVVVRKDQFNLQQWLNAFVRYEKASGELAQLYTKWFKQPMPEF